MSDRQLIKNVTPKDFTSVTGKDAKDAVVEEVSLKYMLKLAAPMIVLHISFTIMQFVDRFMVSRLGTEALAAILPAGFVSFLPASFAIGIMTSVNTFVSQSLGRGSREECSSYCWQVIYMGLVYAVLSLVIMWPFAPLIFRVMGHPSSIIGMEVTYFRIMLYAQIIAVFIWSSSQFFMGIHRPIITMYAALCAQVVNVLANYVLIFGKFGLPAMGIAGAAWGTFAGVVVGASIRMVFFLGGRINRDFYSRKMLQIDFDKMKDLLRVGFPAGLGLMVNVAFWGVILFGLVGRFGKEQLAATSAVFACINVSVMPVLGISTALTASVGKAIGQRRKDIAVKQTEICLKAGLVYMGLIGLCFLLFRSSLMAFWSSDDKVIEAGVKILIFAAVFQVFDAATIIYSGGLRGAGDTIWLAVVSVVGAGVILGLGGVLIVVFLPAMGSIGPWIAATACIIAEGIANMWRFKSNKWMKIDLFKRRALGLPVEIEAAAE
ncbi:MAG: MATE family efflux transporter [Sedimentisphaerales bacterium]|nr:MATE family efflux transporter [Sedimentisphaerales bacterium]